MSRFRKIHRRNSLSLRHIPMRNLQAVSRLVQALTNFFGNHYGTVLAAGATEADGEITLAFVDVMRQQINQEIRNAVNKFLSLGKRPDVFGHARMPSRKPTKLRHEMRVRQKKHVENQ